MSNVFEKLQQSRVDLQKKKLKKSGKNSYSGFTYYELADILPPINEIFYTHKLFSQFNIKNEIATLTITNIEAPDENIIFEMPTAELQLKGCTAIQALGGLNTYCKRYLYLNALEIVENDMLDNKVGAEDFLPIEKPKTAKNKPQEDKEVSYIGADEKATLKEHLGPAKFAKEMNACGGKMTVGQYQKLLVENEEFNL